MKTSGTCQVKKGLVRCKCFMEITYLGHSSFKIKTKEASLVTDPFDPQMLGIKYPISEADVVTISHDHPDHNYLERIRGYRKVITEPGEYELSNISIIGIPSFHDDKNGEEKGKNVIYVFEIEEIRIAHLGDLGHKLTDKMLEDIGEINVLMINSGHPMSLSAKDAVEIVRAIEPENTLPMHYKKEGINKGTLSNLESVDAFLKEVALPVERIPKLSIKISDLSEEEQKIVLLDIKEK